MAKSVVNATNNIQILEEHEERLDNLQAAIAELLDLYEGHIMEGVKGDKSGKKERPADLVESTEYIIGLTESYVPRDQDTNVAHTEPKDSGVERTPDTIRG